MQIEWCPIFLYRLSSCVQFCVDDSSASKSGPSAGEASAELEGGTNLTEAHDEDWQQLSAALANFDMETSTITSAGTQFPKITK